MECIRLPGALSSTMPFVEDPQHFEARVFRHPQRLTIPDTVRGRATRQKWGSLLYVGQGPQATSSGMGSGMAGCAPDMVVS